MTKLKIEVSIYQRDKVNGTYMFFLFNQGSNILRVLVKRFL